MNTIFRVALISSVTAVIGACGGGGGDASSSTSTPVTTATVSAEGVWEGTTSSGYATNMLVLENGELWAMFGATVGNAFMVNGFDRGVGTYSGSLFSGAGSEYTYTGVASRGTFSASVIPGVSLSGTVSGVTKVSFSASPISASNYIYGQAAQLSQVLGFWAGTLLDGTVTSLTIASNGSVVGQSSNGCSFAGTFQPRASGKNVFNVSITFGASRCALPNQTVGGIALAYVTNTGKTQLMVAVTDSLNSLGTMFLAQR